MRNVRRVGFAFAITLLAVAVGCGGGGGADLDGGGPGSGLDGGEGGSGECFEGLTGIEVTPAGETVTLDGSTPAPIQFSATGEFGDRSEDLDAASLGWSATRDDDTPPGTIDAGLYQPADDAGGVVTITASDGCGVSGSASVTFLVDVSIGEPGDPDAWAGDVETGAEDAPTLVYPSHETRFPRNLFRQLFQWRDEVGAVEHRLVFEGEFGTVEVYTDGLHDDCEGADDAGCWEAGENAWSFIASSHAGKTVEVVVDTLDESGSILRSEPITLGFSRQDVEGAIFYWSTDYEGVRRGRISASEPEEYIGGDPETVYSDPEDEVTCVACHTVSYDGQYMAAPTSSDETGKYNVWITEITADAPPLRRTAPVDLDTKRSTFASISPNNRYVAVSYEDIYLMDLETGDLIEEVPIADEGTMPHWSPDGRYLAYTNVDGRYPSDSDASIARIAFHGEGDWGEEEVLTDSELTDLWPMYAPDGRFIAFGRGDGGRLDESAQIFIMDNEGGQEVELINANRVVNSELTDGQHQNAMPTWAPPGDLHWVAFHSQRDYGLVAEEPKQIWVAAIDASKFGTGEDPSYPAFRIPFQGLDEANHRAFWSLDIRDTPPPDQCIPSGESCEPGGDECCLPYQGCFEDQEGGYSCQSPVID